MKKLYVVSLIFVIIILATGGLLIYINKNQESSTIDSCNKKATLEEKDYCFFGLAKEQKDPQICGQISNQNTIWVEDYTIKDGCYEILAVDTEDPSLCEKISLDPNPLETGSPENWRNRCNDEVYRKIAKESKDASKCNFVKDSYRKERCLIEIGKETSNISLCKTIYTNEDSYDYNCVTIIGLNTKDKTVCEVFLNNPSDFDDYMADLCYSSLNSV